MNTHFPRWLALVSLLVAIPGAATAAEKFRLRTDWLPWALSAPFYYAVQKGWFAEAGLDVAIDDGTGSGITVQLVGAGQYDVGMANLATMAVGRTKGVDVVSVGAINRRNELGVIVAKDLNVKSPKDLADKKIKVIIAPGGGFTPYLAVFFRNGGTDFSKIEVMNVNPAAQASSYVAGAAGALLSTVPYYSPLVKTARPSDFLMFEDYGLPLPGFGIVAGRKTITDRPDELRRFLAVSTRAFQAAWGGAQREVVEAASNARPQAKLNIDLEIARIDAYAPFVETRASRGKPMFWQAREDWDAAIKAMIQSEVIPASSKTEDFYTNDFLPAR